MAGQHGLKSGQYLYCSTDIDEDDPSSRSSGTASFQPRPVAQDDILHFQVSLVHALDDVMRRRHRRCHDVDRASIRTPDMPEDLNAVVISTINSCGAREVIAARFIGLANGHRYSISRAARIYCG